MSNSNPREQHIKRELTNIEDYGNYYYADTYCLNCDDHDGIYVLRGVLKPKTVKCEKCGCQTAKT